MAKKYVTTPSGSIREAVSADELVDNAGQGHTYEEIMAAAGGGGGSGKAAAYVGVAINPAGPPSVAAITTDSNSVLVGGAAVNADGESIDVPEGTYSVTVWATFPTSGSLFLTVTAGAAFAFGELIGGAIGSNDSPFSQEVLVTVAAGERIFIGNSHSAGTNGVMRAVVKQI